MSPTMEHLLDARIVLDRASAAHQNAVNQLAICAERWAESRPDRLAPQLEAYRETLRARSVAARAVTLAERAAVAAGDLCGECLQLVGMGCGCAVDARAA